MSLVFFLPLSGLADFNNLDTFTPALPKSYQAVASIMIFMISSKTGASNLVAENQRLRQRVAALEAKATSPISANPEKGEVRVENLSMGPLQVDKLHLQSKALEEATASLQDLKSFLPGSKSKKLDASGLAEKPLLVRALKAKLPIPFVNSMIEQVAGAQFAESGLSEVALSEAEGNQVRLSGKVKKGIKVGFEVLGDLSATKEGKVRVKVNGTKLGGVPMPNFVVSLASRLAGSYLDKAGVSQDQTQFTIDPKRFQPKNVFFQLNNLSLEDGAILLEGGLPVVRGKSSVPIVPRKR